MFIAIEGIDGAGKTTAGILLQKALEEKHMNSHYVAELYHEYDEGSDAEELVSLLMHNSELRKWQETLLFMTIRHGHYHNVIKPLLNAKQTVICDRFVHSTMAYHYSITGNIKDIDSIRQIHNTMFNGEHMPDITFFLDTKLEACKERIVNDLFEQKTLLLSVQKAYKLFFGEYIVIDGNQDLEGIVDDMARHVYMHQLQSL